MALSWLKRRSFPAVWRMAIRQKPPSNTSTKRWTSGSILRESSVIQYPEPKGEPVSDALEETMNNWQRACKLGASVTDAYAVIPSKAGIHFSVESRRCGGRHR